VGKPRGKRADTLAFFCPDTHYPLHDEAAVRCAQRAVELTKPDIFIHLGDVGEWNSISHWRYKRQKRPPLEYQLEALKPEAEAINAGLDSWDRVLDKIKCEKRIMVEGNHEVWLDHFVDAHPYVPQYAPKKLLRLKERGWKYNPYGEYNRAAGSHLYYYHGGHWSGQFHAKQHAEKLGASIIYGHYHDYQVHRLQHLGGAHGAWSIGCLRTLNAEWLKGAPNRWSHNFALAHIAPNGDFYIEVVDIVNGKCWTWGKELAA